jgi:hypothetical protein
LKEENEGNLQKQLLIIHSFISFTCFVVQPCLLSVSLFLISRTTSGDNCAGLPLLGLSLSPSTPSLSYLASQSEAYVLLLRNLQHELGPHHHFQPSVQVAIFPLHPAVVPLCTDSPELIIIIIISYYR